MNTVKLLVRIVSLTAVTWAFFGGPWCSLALRPLDFVWGAAITLVLGRFFCDAVCPLGIVQTLVNWLAHPRRHVRRVCTRLPETKAQRIVRWSVVAVCAGLGAAGCMGLATMAFPLSIFGKAVTGWLPGVAVGALVVALAAVGDGRFWCNWICPFGTVYALLARWTPCKSKVGKGCGNCRRCFGERKPAPSAEPAKGGADPAAKDGITRREAVKGVAVLAAAEKLTDGGYAPVSLPGVPDRGTQVLPPGSGSARSFALKCVGCQLCIARCPGECLAPSVRLTTLGQPVMDFRRGYCLAECARCGEVCPTGAIAFLQREQRPHVHMGHAVWRRELCVRTVNGDQCTACVRKCPVRAIHLVQGFPVVDRDVCIGCGACEHVCPSRPQPAIFVKGHETQRTVKPMSEADLLAEMRARLDAGAAVVAARNGVIVAVGEGRGVAPLVNLHDEGKLKDAVVMDKVVGRAAAAFFVSGGARRVIAGLASKGAAQMLREHEIPLEAGTETETILNRRRDGVCPMEQAVAKLKQPAEMVAAVRKAMEK